MIERDSLSPIKYNFYKGLKENGKGLTTEQLAYLKRDIINNQPLLSAALENTSSRPLHAALGNFPSIILPVDGTHKFEGSVGNAIKYFKDGNPFILTAVKSTNKGGWWQNSEAGPYKFTKLPIEPTQFAQISEWEDTGFDIHNQPVYRMKYLKYKKKYIELKKLIK